VNPAGPVVADAPAEVPTLASSTEPAAPVSRRLTLLGRLVLLEALVLLSTPWWQPRPLGAVLGIALLVVLGLAATRGAGRLRRLRVAWLGPDRAVAGEETVLTLRAWHPDGSPGLVLDTPRGVRGEREAIARLGDLDATGVRVSWETRLGNRGWQPLPPLEAVTTHPFGLIATRSAVLTAHEILVLPGRGLLRRELRRRLDPWIEQVATGTDPGDEEVARLRPYRPGDPPRRVHWRASARARHLVVAERHAPTARAIALVLDTALSPRRLDRLAAIAASFVDHLLRHGWQVTIHGRFAPSGIGGDRRLLLETLALIETSADELPLVSCIPRGRAAIVISVNALTVDDCHPRPLLLTLAECETLVRLPRRLGVT